MGRANDECRYGNRREYNIHTRNYYNGFVKHLVSLNPISYEISAVTPPFFG